MRWDGMSVAARQVALALKGSALEKYLKSTRTSADTHAGRVGAQALRQERVKVREPASGREPGED